jgi:hypothetical protein
MNADYKNVIHAGLLCMEACNICYHACLKEEHSEKLTKCIELARESADTCGFAIQMLQRSSQFTKNVLELCRMICEQCAMECKKHGYTHCKKCAEVCLNCAKECRRMSI